MFKKRRPVNLTEQYKKKEINLLPDIYFKRKRRVRYVLLTGLIFALCVAGFTYQIYLMHVELDTVRADNILTLASIEEKKEEQERQLLLNVLKNRIEYKVDLLKQIESKNASVVQISEAIESALPSGVLYVNVNFNSEESMTIYGKTETESEIPDLIHKLRSMNLFNTVEIGSITRTETEYYDGVDVFYEFTLTCEFGGEPDATDK